MIIVDGGTSLSAILDRLMVVAPSTDTRSTCPSLSFIVVTTRRQRVKIRASVAILEKDPPPLAEIAVPVALKGILSGGFSDCSQIFLVLFQAGLVLSFAWNHGSDTVFCVHDRAPQHATDNAEGQRRVISEGACFSFAQNARSPQGSTRRNLPMASIPFIVGNCQISS